MTTDRRLRPAALAARSFGLAWEGFGFLFPLVLAPSLAISALSYALAGAAATPETLSPAAAFITVALTLIGGFVVTGIACLAALDIALGKRHALGDYLRQTLRHLAPLVGLGLLVSLATSLALILLIVPGLYVAARFLVWTPAVVFENAGWSGLGRAQDLSEGHRWPLAASLLIMGVAGLVAMAAALPLIAMAEGAFAFSILIDAVASTLIYMMSATFGAAAYLRLREIKDGASAAEVAATIG